MKFHQYSDIAMAAHYPGADRGSSQALVHLSIGLMDAAKNVGEQLAQMLAAGQAVDTSFRDIGVAEKAALTAMGQVLWHVDRLAYELGSDLDSVADANLNEQLAHLVGREKP